MVFVNISFLITAVSRARKGQVIYYEPQHTVQI